MTIQSLNPYTNQVEKSFGPMAPDAVQQAIKNSNDIFPTWRDTPFTQRAALMMNVVKKLRASPEKYAKLMTLEMGKLLKEGKEWEIPNCADMCEYYASNAKSILKPVPITDAPTGEAHVEHHPLGVIFGIMPWNFPFYQVIRFAAPNIMAGNTVLFKHASNVPQCGKALEALFQEAGFPKGVMTYLPIRASSAETVIEDTRVRGVSLTGSEAAGSSVSSLAGKYLKKCVMELGGSDPFIVLADANLEKAIDNAMVAKMFNSGQVCTGAKRFIVEAPLYDKFLARFAEGMQKMKPGDPMEATTDFSPMYSESACVELLTMVQTAVKQGAKLEIGGEREDLPGAWLKPTILTGITPDMDIYDKEVFGPVAMIFKAKDADDAIRIANDSPFGLASAIMTEDIERARGLASRIESGITFINSFTISEPYWPFGGVKNSGFGRELGHDGMKEFVNKKLVRIA